MLGPKPLERVEIGPMTADAGHYRAEPARPLVVQARESSPFTRKCRRITAQANTRPSRHGGAGGDEQDDAVRPRDRPAAAPGSDVLDRRSQQCGRLINARYEDAKAITHDPLCGASVSVSSELR